MCDSKWQGVVDTKLDNIECEVEELKETVQSLMHTITAYSVRDAEYRAQLTTTVTAIGKTLEEKTSNGHKYVTHEYVREKFTVPVIVAGIIFILFTVFPTMVGLVVAAAWLLPKLLELI